MNPPRMPSVLGDSEMLYLAMVLNLLTDGSAPISLMAHVEAPLNFYSRLATVEAALRAGLIAPVVDEIGDGIELQFRMTAKGLEVWEYAYDVDWTQFAACAVSIGGDDGDDLYKELICYSSDASVRREIKAHLTSAFSGWFVGPEERQCRVEMYPMKSLGNMPAVYASWIESEHSHYDGREDTWLVSIMDRQIEKFKRALSPECILARIKAVQD